MCVYVRACACVSVGVCVCDHQCDCVSGYTYISNTDMALFDPDVEGGDALGIHTVARAIVSSQY